MLQIYDVYIHTMCIYIYKCIYNDLYIYSTSGVAWEGGNILSSFHIEPEDRLGLGSI